MDRLLNLLATRLGVTLGFIVILGVSIVSGTYISFGLREVQIAREDLELPRLREAFVTQSDLNRLLNLTTRVVSPEDVDAEFLTDFERALDILFVRRDSFARIVSSDNPPREASAVQDAINATIAVGVAAIDEGFANPDAHRQAIYAAAETGRSNLSMYVDQMRRAQADSLRRKADALMGLSRTTAILLAVMTLFSVWSIILLRREVYARTERQRAEKRANFLASFDTMTGLPNKESFLRRLGSEIDSGRSFALALLDLDDFKGINDAHGQPAGDLVLQEISNRLEAHFRSCGGLVARFGSDEFAAILPLEDPKLIAQQFNMALGVVSRPISVDGSWLTINASIGVADSGTVDAVLGLVTGDIFRAAEYALFDAKSSGGNRAVIYDEALELRENHRRALLNDLAPSLERGDFFVVYQPKVILEDASIYGFEALVRWRRNGEIVSPADFIPIAEDCGLIVELDLFVLETACRQFAEWNRTAPRKNSVSVNLSAHHFASMNIVMEVERILSATGIPPAYLTLEMTETVLVEDWESAKNILGGLRQLGVRLSLDDFGTGYSSLAYLRQIQADELKIDRSFVTEVEQSEQARFILDAMVDIARGLGMSIVVEGIETKAQAEILKSFGCHHGQGYYFGAPMPASDAQEKIFCTELAARRA